MVNSINDYDIIVVGGGIAAYCLLFELSNSPKYREKRILQLHCESKFPACSHKTTSVVSVGIHQKGISALGDLLVDSAIAFEDFHKQFSPKGVYKAPQYYIPPASSEASKLAQFNNRYAREMTTFNDIKVAKGASYIIKPEELYGWFEQYFNSVGFSRDIEDKEVLSVTSGVVKAVDREYKTPKVIMATSAYTSLVFNHEALPVGKPVSGSYLTWDDINLGDESFVISKGHFNIIYRSFSNELLFGGTSSEGFIFEGDLMTLKSEYESMCQNLLTTPLPKVSMASVKVGIRHKGKKRMPFFNKCEEGIFVINSLYKNGFTFAFLGGKKVVNLL